MSVAEVFFINGPVIKARPDGPFKMKESVWVGPERLAGEVIRLDPGAVTIQVYEDTTGMMPGTAVEGSGAALSVELGPGLLGQMFDGIQRPLTALRRLQGENDLTYLFISHDLKVVRALAHRVMVMKDGQCIEEGASEDIFTHPREAYTKSLLAAALDG